MKKYPIILATAALVSIIMLPRFLFSPPYSVDTCDKMSSQDIRIMCYAMFSKDYKYCQLVGTYYSCVDFVSAASDLNASYCKTLDAYKEMSCAMTLATKNKDPEACTLLGNSTESNTQFCYYALAPYLDYINLNEDFCNKISEESLRFICLAKVKKDTNLCYNISKERTEKWNCLAAASKDITYCSNAPSYDYCLLLVASATKDYGFCENITTEKSKIDCFLQVKKDANYCNDFKGDLKDYCILNFLKLKNLGLI